MLVHDLVFQGKSSDVAFRTASQITYECFQQQYRNYRNYFHQQGIGPGQNIGLFSRNSAEYVYCYMALSSLGAVVVPLNFQLTGREIAYIVKDSEMTHLISMETLDLDVAVKQLIIADFAAAISERNFEQAPEYTDINENTPCVIIYTSGTTGNPKGAILTHGNLVSNVAAFRAALPPTSSADNILCVLPMYHCFAWTCAVLYQTISASATLSSATRTRWKRLPA